MYVNWSPFWFMNYTVLGSFLTPSRASVPAALFSASQRLTLRISLPFPLGGQLGRERGHSGYLFSPLYGFSSAWLHPLAAGQTSSPGGHIRMTLFKNIYKCSAYSPLQGCKQPWCWPDHIFVNSPFSKLPWVILIWMCHLFLAGTLTKIHNLRRKLQFGDFQKEKRGR